jgi:hypothetical protein
MIRSTTSLPRFAKRTQNYAGVTGGDNSSRYGARYNGSSPDHRAIADLDPLKNYASRADEYVVTNLNGPVVRGMRKSSKSPSSYDVDNVMIRISDDNTSTE